jgi:hypothetical protein
LRGRSASTKDTRSARVACEHALEAHVSCTLTVQQGTEGQLWRFSISGLVPGGETDLWSVVSSYSVWGGACGQPRARANSSLGTSFGQPGASSFFEPGSGRSHKETWTGCIASLTTSTKSSLKASRSVSSLSLAEKASKVFLASYLRR